MLLFALGVGLHPGDMAMASCFPDLPQPNAVLHNSKASYLQPTKKKLFFS